MHVVSQSTPDLIPPSPEGVACVPIPVEGASGQDYSSPEVLWPETPHTPGKLCYCPPFEGDHHLFSRCINTSSCATHYSVAVRNDSVCFAGLHHELTSIPVYFTLLQPCQLNRCIIRSLLARFIITSGIMIDDQSCIIKLIMCITWYIYSYRLARHYSS